MVALLREVVHLEVVDVEAIKITIEEDSEAIIVIIPIHSHEKSAARTRPFSCMQTPGWLFGCVVFKNLILTTKLSLNSVNRLNLVAIWFLTVTQSTQTKLLASSLSLAFLYQLDTRE